jgi:hypothetical protein
LRVEYFEVPLGNEGKHFEANDECTIKNCDTLFGHGGTTLPSFVRLSLGGESSRASAPERHLNFMCEVFDHPDEAIELSERMRRARGA